MSNKSSNIFEIIGNLAEALYKTGDTLSGPKLVDFLNENKHKTKRGTPYSQNGPGIYKVISSAYDYFFLRKGDKTTASKIASAFVNKENKHLWKK